MFSYLINSKFEVMEYRLKIFKINKDKNIEKKENNRNKKKA